MVFGVGNLCLMEVTKDIKDQGINIWGKRPIREKTYGEKDRSGKDLVGKRPRMEKTWVEKT